MVNFTNEMVMGMSFETEEILKEKGDISTIRTAKKTNKKKGTAFVDEKEERRRDLNRKAEERAKRRIAKQ